MPNGKKIKAWSFGAIDWDKPTKPIAPTELTKPIEIPDMPFTVKDPYTGKDVDLTLKQGMFVWKEEELEGFFTKKGDFITTKPEEASFWEKTGAYLSSIWKSIPINPYYWKTPGAKFEADRKDALVAWAKEAGKEDPEKFVEDLLAQESKELAWGAYEPEEGALRVPELLSKPTEREKISVGERFIGEWVIPMAILSGLGLSAIKGRAALEVAKVGKPIATRTALETGRVALAPMAGYEWAVGKTIEVTVGGTYRTVMSAVLRRNLHSWAQSAGITIPKATEDAFIKQAIKSLSPKFMGKQAIKTLFKPTKAGFTVTDAGVKAAETAATQAVKTSPLLLGLVKPPTAPTAVAGVITGAIPKAAVIPPAVEVAKPPTGIRYVFNLKKFRFEPTPIELKPGISPEADKLTNLVKLAKPAREITEGLKHEELSRRVGAAAAAARATGASKAAFAGMGKLKGQLPVATFTPPEAGLTPKELTALFSQVKNKLLIEEENFFKWLNTDAALRKLLAGKIPTRGEIELLENMFGSELAGAILAKRPLSTKVWETTLDVLNVPRAILASYDFSAWLRQGAFIVTGYPSIGARALGIDFRTFFSGKYTAEIDNMIRTGKYAQLRESAGLELTPLAGKVGVKLAAREEPFMTTLADKIPILGIGIKWSERAYISTLNYMRAATFDRYAASWEKMGYSMKTYKQLATLLNWATGRGSLGKLADQAPLINSIFFAAKLQVSRASMLFGGAKFTSPPVRRAYIRMMVRFFGTIGAIVGLLDIAGIAEVEKDPRSSDFGKIRVGNVRLDPWAGFRPIVTLLAQVISGQRKTGTGRIQDISRQEAAERFMRSKYSPAFGLLVDIMKGETFLGEEMSLESESLMEQLYQRLTFLFVQDMIDAVKEDGWVGGVVAIPAILGVGVVTYPGSLDAYERHVADIPDDMLMDWQRGVSLSGMPLTYRDLNVAQKAWLIKHCEDIGDVPERKEPGDLGYYDAERKTREDFEIKLNEEMEPLVEGLLAGRVSVVDYTTQRDYLKSNYFNTASYNWRESMSRYLEPKLKANLDRWHEEEIKPGDVAYEKYMDIRANPPTKDGVPDWGAWHENINDFLSKESPEIVEYIKDREQMWINNLPPERQNIERLLIFCEEDLDAYYGQEEGKARLAYRDANPGIDAKLIIIRGLKPRTGLHLAYSWLDSYGINRGVLGEVAAPPGKFKLEDLNW